MFAGIHEQNETGDHFAHFHVEFLLEFVQFLHQDLQIVELLVKTDIPVFAVPEIPEQYTFAVEDFLLIEAHLHDLLLQNIFEIFAVSIVNETIMEDAHVLMVPQPDQVLRLQDDFGTGQADPLEGLGDVPQVEEVVGFGGGREEFSADFFVDVE